MKTISGHKTPAISACIAALFIVLMLAIPRVASAKGIEVKSVKVEGLYSVGEDELLYLLDIERGKELDRDALRRGIKRAFEKGIFENISVETIDGEDGALLVRVEEKDFVKGVRVEGAPSGSKFVKEQLGLTQGDEFRYDLLDSYRNTVLEAMKQKGYPDAKVTVTAEKTHTPHRIRLLVKVEKGKPTMIKEIKIIGRPDEEVLDRMKVSAGEVYDQFRLKQDIERLTKYYRKRNYLNPVVGPFTFSGGVVHFNVEPGQRLVIRFKGNDHISRKKLLREMPFYDAGQVRDDLIDEAVARMITIYHTKGYPNAQVATVMNTEGETIMMSFFVYEGVRVKVKKVSFKGVSLDEMTLQKVLPLREKAIYNPDLLESNSQVLSDFYSSLGYIDVQIAKPAVVINGPDAFIDLTVNEGVQFVLAGTILEGAESLSEEEVMSKVGLKLGLPYNEVDISDARRAIVSKYREHGFLDVEVNVDRHFEEGGKAYVTFKVTEGKKLRFGKTLVRGNQKTRLRVISRELQYRDGDELNKTEMLNARQRIYKTGLFTDVNMDVISRHGDQGDVVIDLKEGKAGTFEFGLGYGEYDRFRGFFDVGYKNLFGMNRSGSFRTEVSSLMRRYIFRYNDPWFLERRIPLRVYFINEDRKEINIDTGEVKYRVGRYTAGVGVEKQLNDRVTLDLLYEYSFTKTTDVIPDIILSREDTGTLGISSVTPSLTYDSRDNPFDPTKGLYTGVSVKIASLALLSETDFFKLVAFGSTFKELSRRIVLAASVRGGLAQGTRDTTDLPLIERFFLGGRSTVRGFEQDGLGPKGPLGNPIGGNVFFLGNLEFRFRITKSWRFVTFFDTGAVWLDDTDVNFADLRYTAGGGIQYNTPVGPIRLDYGRKLDRKAGESPGEFHFSIGYAF